MLPPDYPISQGPYLHSTALSRSNTEATTFSHVACLCGTMPLGSDHTSVSEYAEGMMSTELAVECLMSAASERLHVVSTFPLWGHDLR